MTTLGLELGSGNLGFNGLLVKSVLEGLTNFNAIDENTCLKRPRVSIRSLYLPEVHCSVFPVPLDSTSPQAQWHIGDSKNTSKDAAAVSNAPIWQQTTSVIPFLLQHQQESRQGCVSPTQK